MAERMTGLLTIERAAGVPDLVPTRDVRLEWAAGKVLASIGAEGSRAEIDHTKGTITLLGQVLDRGGAKDDTAWSEAGLFSQLILGPSIDGQSHPEEHDPLVLLVAALTKPRRGLGASYLGDDVEKRVVAAIASILRDYGTARLRTI